MVSINTPMGLLILVTGLKTNSTAPELKSGQMVLATKDSTRTERSMETAVSALLMEAPIPGSSAITKFQVSVNTFGLTVKRTRVSGTKTKCMGEAHSFGGTESVTKDSS